MEKTMFDLRRLFEADKSSSFALQPFIASFVEICEATGMTGMLVNKFTRDVKERIRLIFGGYESHFEGNIEHVHGVRLTDWFYASYPQNSIGHIENELSLWYSEEIGSDDTWNRFFRTPFGCGYDVDDDGMMNIYNFSLKNGSDAEYQWQSVPSGIVNGYLLEKYRCFVSAVLMRKDSGGFGFAYIINQHNDGKCPVLVNDNDVIDGMLTECGSVMCKSEMGAFSLAFSVLRDRIIESKLSF